LTFDAETSIFAIKQPDAGKVMASYVLVHVAWHTVKELKPTASPIRAAGHQVYTPTIAGNKPGDPKTIGLQDAITSIVDYLTGPKGCRIAWTQ
jgi:hypothetical protein